MTDFRDAVLLGRYIGEIRAKAAAQEKRVRKLQLAGRCDADAERLLTTLRGSLAALELEQQATQRRFER